MSERNPTNEGGVNRENVCWQTSVSIIPCINYLLSPFTLPPKLGVNQCVAELCSLNRIIQLMGLKGVFFVNGAFELCVLGAHVAEPAPLMTMMISIWRVFFSPGLSHVTLFRHAFLTLRPSFRRLSALRQKIC